MACKEIDKEMVMADEAFMEGLNELYQGEVVGEVIFNRMLASFNEPEQRYKIAVMLQLETETKARLRPTLMQVGLDISERNESRQAGQAVADSIEGKDWKGALSALQETVKPYVDRYKQIAAAAPPEYRAVAESMAIHEQSLYEFIELELAGDSERALAELIAQLHNVLPAP
jgi:hypothetical protein